MFAVWWIPLEFALFLTFIAFTKGKVDIAPCTTTGKVETELYLRP
jgi:hypothetical protein